MILYKNVDIKDLDSILNKGILSLNECGNNNWGKGKRAENSCDVVYLFKPLQEENSFCRYGVALLEISTSKNKVKANQMAENDVHNGKYIEYIVERVLPEQIINIYIPIILKNKIQEEMMSGLSFNVLKKVNWVEMTAKHYKNGGRTTCSYRDLKQFAETAPVTDSTEFNFFRGVENDGTVMDLYEVNYIF